jgi:predicted transposase YbfD/YdcC
MEKRYHNFLDTFASLPDPRISPAKIHLAGDILFIAMVTLLTGGRSFYDMEECGHGWESWFRETLPLEHGIPSHDTFNRFFQILDSGEFERCFQEWAGYLCSNSQGLLQGPEIVAVDGKTHRRTFGDNFPALHVVNAWASNNQVVLGQLAVDKKSNEITAVPQLLKNLMLKGCIVTADALNCQKDIAEVIIEKEADYVLAIKGNHKTAFDEIKLFMDEVSRNEAPHFESIDKEHGRLEHRRYWQSVAISWFEDAALWAGLRSFGLVESVREWPDGKIQAARRYYISSLPFCPQLMAEAIRRHWGVENQVHYCLDVFFSEDQSRARTKNAAKNLGLLRNTALNILRNDPSKKSLSRKMYAASLNPNIIKSWLTC